jgi:hypothetical protein
MRIVDTFAHFITNLALLGLIAIVALWIMFRIGIVMQSAARRRMIVATKRGYELAGKPVEPPAERRHRIKRAA